jgi:hypothetical protein
LKFVRSQVLILSAADAEADENLGNSQYVDLPPLRFFFAPIAFSAFKSHPGDAADMVVSDYVSL